jgi:hypothetical protein
MTLYAFISNIWTAFSPSPPPKKRGRRPAPFSPNTIEPVNYWYRGDRSRHGPRRLDDTPNSAHYPKFRIAKSVVTKRRKRCEACGALVKDEQPQLEGGIGKATAPVKTVRNVKRKTPARKAPAWKDLAEMDREYKKQGERVMEEGMAMRRALRGRVVEYDG